ncbi:hypothetical protein DFJ74DRAFT_656073 [Hyaloraphidium curvatum]|nr:hypothetical protein DFJ74DRAFT_656073 [Hyaloraphidium curvatum]
MARSAMKAAALALAAALVLLVLATPADAQRLNDKTVWLKGATCAKGASYPGGCCCARPKTTLSTKFTTKTTTKTVKSTKTVTSTITSTTLIFTGVPRRMERDTVPELLERDLPEPAVEDVVADADEAVAEPEISERSLPEEPESFDEFSPAEEGHSLFARNLCQACPKNVVPLSSGSGNTKRCCVLTSTKFTTRTKTTTRVKTSTVKSTKTITVTSPVPAAAVVPVEALSQTTLRLAERAGTPIAGAVVELQGPAPGFAPIKSCTTEADGKCTILLPFRLDAGAVYRLVILSGAPSAGTTLFTATPAGQPPVGPGGTIPVTVTETNTVALGRRELLARREADGEFRRALKARATPGPAAF